MSVGGEGGVVQGKNQGRGRVFTVELVSQNESTMYVPFLCVHREVCIEGYA